MKCKGGGDSEMGTEFPRAYSQLENQRERDTRPSSERQEEFLKISILVVHKEKKTLEQDNLFNLLCSLSLT